jgi:hypothetical protein
MMAIVANDNHSRRQWVTLFIYLRDLAVFLGGCQVKLPEIDAMQQVKRPGILSKGTVPEALPPHEKKNRR